MPKPSARRDPVRGRCSHVDVVVADRDVGDDLEHTARAGRDDPRVDGVGEQRDDRIARLGVRAELGGRVRRIAGLGPHDIVTRERVEPAVGQAAGHKHSSH
jgi:hypothetical protein